MRSPEQCLAELIEKMKALAESTPFAAEAATARALVQELIARNAQRPQHVPFVLDPDNLPPLLRESDIVRDSSRKYPGLVPLTRSAWLDAVNDGYIPPPVMLGSKAKAWPREVILKIMREGVGARRPRGRRAEARALLRVTHKAEAEAAQAKTKNKPKKKGPARRPRPALADATP